jgi:aromatic ring-opening dioxygenase catalytic subunit (LigB family)
MAQIVGGFALSHGSFMVSRPELVTADTRNRCYAAYEKARQLLAEYAPDVVLLIGTDHFNTFSYDAMPQWCIGRGEVHEGWADNIPMYKLPGAPALAADLIDGLLAQGFEPAFSDAMRLDHSFLGPLHFITPGMDIPVVPVFQNCITRPFLTLRRAYALGQAIFQAVSRSPVQARVVIIGSGGLSHWLGGPEHGRVSEEFDREFLQHFVSGDRDGLTQFTDEEIESLAGNGGHEIRNWLTVRGALPSATVEVLYYEPIPAWLVGASVARLSA